MVSEKLVMQKWSVYDHWVMELKRNKQEPFSIEEEEELWKKGLLGNSSPQVLYYWTQLYLWNVFFFALRSGQEHRNLQFAQI